MPEEKINLNDLDNRRLLYLATILIFSLSVISLISLFVSRGVRQYESDNKVVETKNPFESIVLNAKSALVYDVEKKKTLYEYNSQEPLALASVTKIMTAVTALDLLPKSSVITIDREFLQEEGDTGLQWGEKWALKDLLDFSLLVSSNDGTVAIAAAAGAMEFGKTNLDLERNQFVKKMNEKAKSIGMTHSVFYNETGLDIQDEINGGYASAEDVAKLFDYALRKYPEIFEATRYKELRLRSLNNINHNATNTNSLIDTIPGIVGSKTGFTDLAGGNLGIIFDPGIGRPIIIVVLGSTYDGRFSDTELLSEKTLEAIALSE